MSRVFFSHLGEDTTPDFVPETCYPQSTPANKSILEDFMFRPITFLDPDCERNDLIAIASDRFTSEYWHHQAAGFPAPSPEEVFPELFQLAHDNGFSWTSPIVFAPFSTNDLSSKLQQLQDCISVVFDDAPFAVETLLGFSPLSSLPSTTMSDQTEATSDIPEQQLPIDNAATGLSIVPPVLPPRPFTALPTPTTTPSPASEDSDPIARKKPDIAYSVTQDLLRSVRIKILGEAIYSYTGSYYRHITAENLRRLIMAFSRNAVESEGNARLIGEVYKLLLCEPLICEQPEQINENLVSFLNGVLDLTNWQFHPHNPRFNTYYELQATYLPGPAPHPTFDQFLYSLTCGDTELSQRVLEIIGYCLVPDVKGKVFFVFQGVPDSGKSVLAAFIRNCLNKDAVVALDILSLGERFSTSALIGKQLCTSMDLPAMPLNSKSVSTFKTITGGDPLTCDMKYASHVTFYNTAKFICGTNHPLLTQSSDYAFYRRAIVVPFLNSIAKSNQDFFLLDKLSKERDAIVFDAIWAYANLKYRNYEFSGFYELNDIFEGTSMRSVAPSIETQIKEFIQKRCTVNENGVSFVTDLYDAFSSMYGEGIIPSNRFSTLLLSACEELGIQKVQKASKQRIAGEGNPRARIKGIVLSKGNIQL